MAQNRERKLLKPAKLDDELSINTPLIKLGKVSFDFNQEVFVGDTLVTQAKIQCGCLDYKKFTPSSLPEYLHNGMKKLI